MAVLIGVVFLMRCVLLTSGMLFLDNNLVVLRWYVLVLCIVLVWLDTGRRASLSMLGMVQWLPKREIWLYTKSCFMLLSLMNVVPLITRQWRFYATMALNLSMLSFL